MTDPNAAQMNKNFTHLSQDVDAQRKRIEDLHAQANAYKAAADAEEKKIKELKEAYNRSTAELSEIHQLLQAEHQRKIELEAEHKRLETKYAEQQKKLNDTETEIKSKIRQAQDKELEAARTQIRRNKDMKMALQRAKALQKSGKLPEMVKERLSNVEKIKALQGEIKRKEALVDEKGGQLTEMRRKAEEVRCMNDKMNAKEKELEAINYAIAEVCRGIDMLDTDIARTEESISAAAEAAAAASAASASASASGSTSVSISTPYRPPQTPNASTTSSSFEYSPAPPLAEAPAVPSQMAASTQDAFQGRLSPPDRYQEGQVLSQAPTSPDRSMSE